MKILLTGATGFIGGHILKHFDKTHNVSVTYRGEIPKETRKVHYCDLSVQRQVEETFRRINPDVVIHMASKANSNTGQDKLNKIIDDNIVSTLNLCEQCNNGIPFVLASSAVVYSPDELEVGATEDAKTRPQSVYGVTKLASEGIVDYYNSKGKIRGGILRMTATVGTGLTHGVLKDFIEKAQEPGPTMEAWGKPPGSIKPFSHVNDVITTIEHFLKNCEDENYAKETSEIFNVCPEDNISVEEIANIVFEELGVDKTIDWDETKTWVGDNKVILCKKTWGDTKFQSSADAIRQAVKEIIK